ncbi:MAG: PAS domain S-box protein, partial [Deltaproteobacteria bacterium]|nr:PAS domain S-box protein [Deltaproteobacteria bacterium]
EDAPFAMSIMRPDKTFEYLNPKFTEIFGYTLDDLPTKDVWFQKAYPDEAYRKEVVAVWSRDSIKESRIGEIKPRVFTVRCKDGEEKTIHFRAVFQKDGRQFITYEDITDRARIEEALRRSEEGYKTLYRESKRAEELYRSLLNSSADAVVIYDLEGKTLYISPAFTELFGWTIDEIKGKRIPFVPDAEREATMAVIRDILEIGKPCQSFETKRTTRDGRVLDVSISASRYLDDEGTPAGMLSMLRDISQRKRLEAQLLQAHKMEAIGTLAGGISHDFNNILQVISGYSQILLMSSDPTHSDHAKLEAIDMAARRGGDLTKRLLIFSRKVEAELRPVDLNQAVLQVTRLLERTIPRMIRIETDLAQDLDVINADPLQLEQIMMNLGVNARDAMPEGGILTFKTANRVLDEAYCKAHVGTKAGEHVELKVSDTGQGMEEEVQEHIFEPFFSTKETGKGTGLGLAMVYGIVKNHGGYVTFDSRPGHGTTFQILFPMLKTEGEAPGVETRKEEELPGGSERVLVVDDEKPLLEMLEELLIRFGYDPVLADSGERAIEILKSGKDKIDLVILDLSMPGMGGYRCLQEMIRIDPDLKVLIASGYSANKRVREVLRSGAAGFIAKPYHYHDLLKKIREFLDEKKKGPGKEGDA